MVLIFRLGAFIVFSCNIFIYFISPNRVSEITQTHTHTHNSHVQIYKYIRTYTNDIHTYDRLRRGNWTAWHGRHYFIH